MVIAVEDIVDSESLEAWLNERPEDLRQQCSVWMAARAAARVAPISWDWFGFEIRANDEDHRDDLAYIETLLIAYVGIFIQTPQICEVAVKRADSARYSAEVAGVWAETTDIAADSKRARAAEAAAIAAAMAADVLASPKDSLSVRAVEAMLSADLAADRQMFSTLRNDCSLWLEIESGGVVLEGDLQPIPLLPNESPLNKEWAKLKKKLSTDSRSDDPRSADWSFWKFWYNDLMNGQILQIDMLYEIVTTDQINWDETPQKINNGILSIVSGYRGSVEAGHRKQLEKLRLVFSKERARISDLEDQIVALNDKLEARFQSVVTENAIKGPSKLWDDKKDEHKEKSQTAYRLFIRALVVMAIILGGVTYCLIWGDIDKLLQPYGCDLQSAPELCGGFSLKGTIVSILFATILALRFGFIRLQLKVFLSERHLMLDARERMAFADAYVSLLRNKDNAEGAAEQGLIVYNALFRPTSDGFIKVDGGVDPSLSAAIAKFLAK